MYTPNTISPGINIVLYPWDLDYSLIVVVVVVCSELPSLNELFGEVFRDLSLNVQTRRFRSSLSTKVDQFEELYNKILNLVVRFRFDYFIFLISSFCDSVLECILNSIF